MRTLFYFVLVLSLSQCTWLTNLISEKKAPTKIEITKLSSENLLSQVFMGQAYPTGYVYLQAFSEEKQVWPQELLVVPLVKKNSPQPGQLLAVFKTDLKDDYNKEESTIKNWYIPNGERMEEDHNDCGLGKTTVNPAFSYIDDFEFFRTVMDHCNSVDPVGKFLTKPNEKYSYWVLAVPSSWGSVEISELSGKRPTSEADLATIKEEKSNLPPDGDCSTQPAYIDSAELKFSVKHENHELKISHYSTPGCAGHVSDIYVLDFFEDSKLVKTFNTFNYFGPI